MYWGANVAEANEQAQTVVEEKQEALVNQSNSNETININEIEQNAANSESAAELKEENKKEETPEAIVEESKKVQESSLEAQEEAPVINDDQVKAVSNEVDVELSEENVGGVQKAPEEGKTEPNYSEDEAKNRRLR